MTLARPRVVGPLSELSRKVRVRGQLVGADVTVVSLGSHRREIARGQAMAADQRFDLPQNVKLLPDDALVAVQRLGSESSANPDASMSFQMGVMRAPTRPAELGYVGLVSTLFECGRALWLRGGFPGADANVRISGAVAGTGTFLDSEGARLRLSTPLGSATVEVFQSVPGLGEGPRVQRIPITLAGRPGDPVAPPVADPSPVACDESLYVTHAIDGAEVVVSRSDGRTSSELRALFDRAALRFPLGTPLTPGRALPVRNLPRRPSRPTFSLREV
jgi:hypothetical protein